MQLIRSSLRIGIFSFVGLLCLGQFQKIVIGSLSSMYIHELLLVFVLMATFLLHPKEFISTYFRTKVGVAIILFVISIGISLLVNSTKPGLFLGISYAVRFILYSGIYGVVNVVINKHILSRVELIQSGLFVLLCMSLEAILQYVFFPDMRWLTLLGWDDHYLRSVGTLFDPAFLGSILVAGVSLISLNRKNVLLLGIGLFALLLTYSRASFIAIAIALIYLSIMKKSWKPLLVLITLCICVVLLPSFASEGTLLNRTTSVQSRSVSIQQSLIPGTWKEKIIGKGWYLAKSIRQPIRGIMTSHSSAPDNSLVHVWESLGFVGILSFSYLLWRIWQQLQSVKLKACFLSLLIGSMFNNVLFYPYILILIFTVLGQQSVPKIITADT